MYGKTVTLDGLEYFVWCTPETPHSEILRRAMYQAERHEKEQAERRMKTSPYYAALRNQD